MIGCCSDDGTRRILNFPAVAPCESVSLSTLLPSLISIGRSISAFKSKPLFTNRRNSRRSINLVETLVVFLEEIRVPDSGSDISLTLCLSELHVLFQKLRFLLEDCNRDEARLFILMKSEDVSLQFRFLMSGISTALDVILFSGLDVEDEPKEVADFVRNQIIETGFDHEEDDDRIRKKMMMILDGFERGISPKSSELKRVLVYIGIRRWIDCDSQFKFLHSESVIVSSSADKTGFLFLRSLMSLMIYSRCTLFGAVERDENLRSCSSRQCDESEMMMNWLSLDDFRCPISLEIMTDPVVLSSGHTYDRGSIVKWFESGKRTCPKTGEMLPDLSLVENEALKRLIKLHCLKNGIPFPEPKRRRQSETCENSLAAENAIRLVSSFLVSRLVAGDFEDQLKAAMEIHLLTKTSVFNRSCLVEAGAIPPLLRLVSSPNPDMQHNAVSCIRNLSKISRIGVEYHALETIVKALNQGLTMKVRHLAASALFNLASDDDSRSVIALFPSAITGLMNLIRDGPDRAKRRALVTIFGLLLHPENHHKMMVSGLVQLVTNTMNSSSKDELTADCLAVLAILAEKPEGAAAVFASGAFPIIIRILGSSNSKSGIEYCISVLLSLCMSNEGDVVPVLVKNSASLMDRLYYVVSSGSSWARKKANSLIGIVHRYGDEESVAMTTELPREHVVIIF